MRKTRCIHLINNNKDQNLAQAMCSSLKLISAACTSAFVKVYNSVEEKCKDTEATVKAFRNDLFLAISSFIELLAPLFDLELIFKLLEKKHNLIPKLVSISIRDFAFIDQQLSDENHPILLG